MARTTSSVKHTHQYHKVNGLWHCSGIEGCTHYMPKNMPVPVGRQSLCWNCMKGFMLTPVNMEDDRPMCDPCTERLDVVGNWLEKKVPTVKKTGLSAFGAHNYVPPTIEKDEIEVYPEDEKHAPECEVHVGGECTCM